MELQTWKKVLEADLDSLCLELKELIEFPCVIVLTGEMGSGKTTFVRHFVKQVAPMYSIVMKSPTYSIINDLGAIVHADFYRLQSQDEIINLELELYQEHTDYFLIEWGKSYLPTIRSIFDLDLHYYELIISVDRDRTRNIELHNIDEHMFI